jgi:ureidoglycolate lyase
MQTIDIEPLTKSAFAEFGDVIDGQDVAWIEINQGFARRVNDLASIDVSDGGGSVNISLFTAKARPQPIAVSMMERHPLGSQLFYPLQDSPWLVLVCADPSDRRSYRAFRATGQQGVNYAKGVWHHPLLVLADNQRFIVVDRVGPGDNLQETWLDAGQVFCLAPQS